MNHSFIHSTETGRGRGRDGISGFAWGDGVQGLNNPYVVAPLPQGMSEKDFMDRIDAYTGWNSGGWLPWVNDCHTDTKEAFDFANVPYPGAPNGRIDIDDQVQSTVEKMKQYMRSKVVPIYLRLTQ